MEYQEKSKIDVKNMDKNKNTILRPVYEVIDAPFFEAIDIFPQDVLDLCLKIQLNLIFYHLMSG